MSNFLKRLKIKRRAIATLAGMHFFGNPSAKLKIIGVTGTSGKTTTATLLYRIATSLGYKAGLVGSVENLVAGEKMTASYTVPHGTPDPIFLNQLLNKMVVKGCAYVFMEVTSQGMDQKRVSGINFTGGIFTNLSQDHLDYHKDMEDYFQAKKKFFKFLPRRAFALSNADDKNGLRILQGIKANPFTFGFSQDPDGVHFHGEVKKLNSEGLELTFNNIPIKAKLLGKFNAYNLLAVWSACSLLGFEMDKVNKILENINPPRGRFQHFTTPGGVLVVVDYAHKPDALEKIFSAVKETKATSGKIISVFGCGGDRDPFKRPIMGKIGAENSDIAIFTSDNPRSEDPNDILKQMQANLSPEELEKVKIIPDRREAILESVKLAKDGDIILCAGKGDEDYQIIKGVTSHFDDMEEYQKAYSQK